MKKRTGLIAAVILTVATVFVGCSSTAPVASQLNFPADGTKYEILGRVTVKNGGYTNLLKEAKKLYPTADDVVNVYQDAKGSDNIILSGIAIHYKGL